MNAAAVMRFTLAAAAAVVAAVSCSVTVEVFLRDSACPVGGRTATGVTSFRTCAVECASSSNCSAYHFNGSACTFGTFEDWHQRWQESGGCESHVSWPKPHAALAAKLLAFYNFRLSFDNFINKSQLQLAPNQVQRNRSGAHFLGNLNSYITIDLGHRSFMDLLPTASNEFTFFTKVTGSYSKYYPLTLHNFYNASDPHANAQVGGKWWFKTQFMTTGEISSSFWSTASNVKSAQAEAPLPDIESVLRFAFSHSSAGIQIFNNNLTAVAGTNSASSLVDGADTGIRIGYDKINENALTGSMQCYAIAAAALNEAELLQLDALC